MHDVLLEVEFVHDDRYDGHHPRVDGPNNPGGPASLAGPSHYVVCGGQAQSLDLGDIWFTSKLTKFTPPPELYQKLRTVRRHPRP